MLAHVAAPLEFTVEAPQPVLALQVTVPVGTTGDTVPESCAVKVTCVPTLTVLEGAADKPSVGVSAFTV